MFTKNQKLTVIASLLVLSTNLQAVTCNNENTVVTATTEHLEISSDGLTVYDPKTDLTWQRCGVGQNWDGSNCSGAATSMNWQQALESAGSGWRLPNIKELASIIEQRCWSPAIDTGFFPNTPNSYYWSSSPYAYYNNFAWALDFNYGGDGASFKNSHRYVRLVRSGQ
ncbi:MAG: DUF1566 domain-containing protein [Thiolinea sp.]